MKTNEKKHLTAAHINNTSLTIDAPTEVAPSVPEGFVAAGHVPGLVSSMQTVQRVNGDKVADDLDTMQEGDLGPSAPSSADLASMARTANKWTHERIRAEAWAEYTRAQEAVAWTPVANELEAVKPLFLYRAGRDAEFASKHRALAGFFAARVESAARGLRTKVAKAKAKSKEPVTTPVAVAPPVDPSQAGPTS